MEVVKLVYSNPRAQIEGLCHRCSWSWFNWTAEDTRQDVLAHIDRAHINPVVYEMDVKEFPGYGAGIN